jgi:hypothetical protein
MTDSQKLAIALKALERIANCPEGDCERYVAKVDAIAVEALVQIECGE